MFIYLIDVIIFGFGLTVANNSKELTHDISDAVLESVVRFIPIKGWSDRLGSKNQKNIENQLPDEVCDADSGTTGALLRFG